MKKKLLSLLLSMVMLFSLLPAATIFAGAASFDTQAAIDYANTWSGSKRNPAYQSQSKDCANYVSQCLVAGGLSTDSTWKPQTGTWKYADSLLPYLVKERGVTLYIANNCSYVNESWVSTYLSGAGSRVTMSNSLIEPGMLIWTNGSGHVMICVGKKNGTPVYNGHSNDRTQIVVNTDIIAYAVKINAEIDETNDNDNDRVIKISPTDYPTGTCNLQNGYPLAGSITSNYPISSVKAEILDASGNVVMTSSQNVNTTNFTIRRSAMDMNLKFSELPNGTYKLRYTATNAILCETWTSGSFTVTGSSAGGKTAEIEYFNCNVKLICQSGQVVNLYANPGDSSRVSYFSKGQTASSTYGAKLSDGSTWYRITVNDTNDGGKEKVMWLKVTSSVTVTDKHSHNYISSVTEPTCTAQGYTTHTCSCGESYKDSYTSALGHSYTSVITKASTENAEGVRTYRCSRCGHSYTESIPKQTHTNHNYISTITAPTCTAQGYTTHTCSCGESYKDSYTSALGHSYTSVITKTSTENAEGVRTYTCSRCGHSYTESTPKQIHTDHTYITAITAPTCTAQGYTTYTCTVCGDSYQDDFTPTVAHNYTVEITRTATASLAGLKTYTCTVCSAQYTEEYRADMPALPFNDVPNSAYYHSAVVWAYNNNVTLGTSATTFSPSSTCTRAQVVTFLWRAMGEPAPRTTKNSFADVQAGSYYYDAVLWAVEQGITTGTAATQFSPDDTCSNAHILTFLWRCMGKPMDNGSSLWYQDALSWASSSALLADTSAFANVDGDCPRSDVVTFLYRSVGY